MSTAFCFAKCCSSGRNPELSLTFSLTDRAISNRWFSRSVWLTLMRFWSVLLSSLAHFLAYCCWHRLLFGIFPLRGSEGCSFGLVSIEMQISVVVLTWWSFESLIFCFSWRRVHRPSYRFLMMTLPTLYLFHLSPYFLSFFHTIWFYRPSRLQLVGL